MFSVVTQVILFSTSTPQRQTVLFSKPLIEVVFFIVNFAAELSSSRQQQRRSVLKWNLEACENEWLRTCWIFYDKFCSKFSTKAKFE
jgi:hypothetical protein